MGSGKWEAPFTLPLLVAVHPHGKMGERIDNKTLSVRTTVSRPASLDLAGDATVDFDICPYLLTLPCNNRVLDRCSNCPGDGYIHSPAISQPVLLYHVQYIQYKYCTTATLSARVTNQQSQTWLHRRTPFPNKRPHRLSCGEAVIAPGSAATTHLDFVIMVVMNPDGHPHISSSAGNRQARAEAWLRHARGQRVKLSATPPAASLASLASLASTSE